MKISDLLIQCHEVKYWMLIKMFIKFDFGPTRGVKTAMTSLK